MAGEGRGTEPRRPPRAGDGGRCRRGWPGVQEILSVFHFLTNNGDPAHVCLHDTSEYYNIAAEQKRGAPWKTDANSCQLLPRSKAVQFYA
jgi:hypothetical protein